MGRVSEKGHLASEGQWTITTIGFDADDTLWHNERVFRLTQERFAATACGPRRTPDHLLRGLLAAERRNLAHYGFGVKGFRSVDDRHRHRGSRRERCRRLSSPSFSPQRREMLAETHRALPHAREPRRWNSQRTIALSLLTKGDLIDSGKRTRAVRSRRFLRRG